MNIFPLLLLSCLMLFCFISFSVGKFGFLPSYSAYSSKWNETIPIQNMNLWSIITFIAAFCIMPVLLEMSDGSNFQFLGFFTPVYLIAVSLTPKWASDPNEHKYHVIFASLCALCAFLYIILTLHQIWVLVGVLLIIGIVAVLTKTYKTNLVFWLEMIMFLGMYLSLII